MASAPVDYELVKTIRYKDNEEKSWLDETLEFQSAVIRHHVIGKQFTLHKCHPFSTKCLLAITIDVAKKIKHPKVKSHATDPTFRKYLMQLLI